jgi:hypothetical protein
MPRRQKRQNRSRGQWDFLVNEKIFDFFMTGHPQGLKPIASSKVPDDQIPRQCVKIEQRFHGIRGQGTPGNIDPLTKYLHPGFGDC